MATKASHGSGWDEPNGGLAKILSECLLADQSFPAGASPAVSMRLDAKRPSDEFKQWTGPGLNRRHQNFQSCALPTELPVR